jgi:hypothetical protein
MAEHETVVQEMVETDVNQAINEINLFLRRHALSHTDTTPGVPQCHWCYDNFLVGSPIHLQCGHIFCRQCLNACFRTGMANRRSFPPSCCAQPIEFSSIVGHLDQAVALRYTQKQAEYSIRDPTWWSIEVQRTFDARSELVLRRRIEHWHGMRSGSCVPILSAAS